MCEGTALSCAILRLLLGVLACVGVAVSVAGSGPIRILPENAVITRACQTHQQEHPRTIPTLHFPTRKQSASDNAPLGRMCEHDSCAHNSAMSSPSPIVATHSATSSKLSCTTWRSEPSCTRATASEDRLQRIRRQLEVNGLTESRDVSNQLQIVNWARARAGGGGDGGGVGGGGDG